MPPVVPAGAFVAVLIGNIALAFGPWFVRLADTGPVAAGFWRLAIAAPVLLALAWGAERRAGLAPFTSACGLWLLLALSGVAFAGDLGAWHLGIHHTSLANATLFGNCATFVFPLWGFLVARTWPTRLQGLALGLAAAGGALLLGRSYQLRPEQLFGDLLCLVAGLLYAVYFVMMARVRTAMAPLPALALSTVFAVPALWLFAMALGERVMPVDWTPLVAMALTSQVIGQGLMIYGLGRLPPLVIGLALLVQPVVAGAVGWFVYGERLGAADFVGAALIAAALVMVRQPAARDRELA